MSSKYLYIILIAVILIAVCELFPPWRYWHEEWKTYHSAGYHWRFDPPKTPTQEEGERIIGRSHEKPSYLLDGKWVEIEGPVPIIPVTLKVLPNGNRLRGQEILIIIAALGCIAFICRRRVFIALIIPATIETIVVFALGFLIEQLEFGAGFIQFLEFILIFVGAACVSIYLLRRAGVDRFWQTYLLSVASASLPWLMLTIIGATISVNGTGGYFWLGIMWVAMILWLGTIITLPITLLIYRSLPKTRML